MLLTQPHPSARTEKDFLRGLDLLVLVWCFWQTAAPCQVDGLPWPLSRVEWVWVCVCLMEDQAGLRCRQGAWLSVYWVLCVCACVYVDWLGNVATAGAKPFHNMGRLAKGIMQSSVSECLWFVCVKYSVCVFLSYLPKAEPVEALAGNSTLNTWLTAYNPSFRRQSWIKTAQAACLGVCSTHIQDHTHTHLEVNRQMFKGYGLIFTERKQTKEIKKTKRRRRRGRVFTSENLIYFCWDLELRFSALNKTERG